MTCASYRLVATRDWEARRVFTFMMTCVQDVRIREGITVALGGTIEEEETPPPRPTAPSAAPQAPQAPTRELTEEQQKAEEKKRQGNELYKARKFEEALKAYDEAIALDPNELLYLNNKAG